MRQIFTLIISLLIANATVYGQSAEMKKHFASIEAAEREQNLAKACSEYKAAINYCRQNNEEQHHLTNLLLGYCIILSYAGDYSKAIATLNEAAERNHRQPTPDKEIEAKIYMQFGVINFFQKRFDDALFYYRKSEAIAVSTKNKMGISIAKNNIANVYQKKGEYRQAIDSYRKCIKLQEELQDTATLANTYFNLGSCYEELSIQDRAKAYYKLAYSLAHTINDIEILSLSLIHLANIDAKQGEYSKAHNMLDEAEFSAKKAGLRQVLAEVYSKRMQIYEQKGDYRAALEVFKDRQLLLDSILDEKLKLRTKELQIEHQTKEKEQQIALQNVKIKNRNRLLIIVMTVLIAGIVMIIVLLYLDKKLTRQRERLEQLNATKDKLFSIISHDLKSPAVAQQLATDVLVNKVKRANYTDILTLCKLLQDNTQQQVATIETLMNWTRMQTNKIKYTPLNIDIVPIIEEKTKLYSVAAQNKSLIINTRLPDSCIVYADPQMIGIVVQNIINNAIKFTPEGKTIDINCIDGDNDANISIVDSGAGMTPEQLAAIDNPQEQVEVRFGTNGERGTGLGLALCRDLLEKNRSRLIVESRQQVGTTVGFTLRKN